MSVKGYQLRLGLFAGAVVLLAVNALSIWGEEFAQVSQAVLQAVVGLATIVCAAVVARRVRGLSRLWRVLVVVGCSSWLLGELLWWTEGAATGSVATPTAVVVAYFVPLLSGLAAMVALVRAGRGVTGRPETSLRHFRALTILDGLVAAAAFAILAYISGFGDTTGAVLRRSDATAIAVACTVTELIVVVTGLLMAVVYRPDRPYRANYLFLAGGIIVIATSDRIVAYFRTVGFDGGDLWGAIGFTVGPLMVAFAVLDLAPEPVGGWRRDVLDWAQLILPYVGFLGIALLFAFHVVIGRPLNAILIESGVLMAFLVAARQVVAMHAQRVLTQQLYEVQSRLAHQVHHDSLTGLPNRVLFSQRLDVAMGKGRFVLIYVDLDDFKEVNDRFGHAGGDELLRAVGERLQRCVAEGDTLARLGGDEFAILIDGQKEPAEIVADRIRVALRDPFAVGGSSVRIRASLGLVGPGPDGHTPTSDDLLRQADSSMYAGKRAGKDIAVIYGPSPVLAADFPTTLRQAKGRIPAGFSLAYQPIVRLPDEVPVAVEALARWTAPNGTQIPPETFVAAAEAAGLGSLLDVTVLDMACREVAAANLDLDLHVNIGAARLGDPSFEREVRQTLARHGMPPRRLTLEITEAVPIVDLADAAAQIARLNAAGVKVALDDFGAGYNSLTYLHALPVQIVKLDRGLAVGVEPDRGAILYRSVVGICDALGLEVIAEGVESCTQGETVFLAGCRLAQGHLFGQPVPIADICSMSSPG